MTTEREQLEARLAYLHGILKRIEDCNEQREALILEQQQRLLAPKSKWGFFMFIVIAAAAFVAMVILTLALQPPGLAILLLLMLPVLIAWGVISLHNRQVLATNADREATNRDLEQAISEEQAPDFDRIDQEEGLARAAFLAGNVSTWFPENYLTAKDVGACWQIVHDHRATTMAEIINIHRRELHEEYMRDNAKAQLAEQVRTRQLTDLGNSINAYGHRRTRRAIRD